MNLSLSSSISDVKTECAVTGGIEGLFRGGIIQIESEKIYFTAASADGFLQLTRGILGTTAVAHPQGSVITIIAKNPNIDVQMSDGVVILEGPGIPVDTVTGASVAEIGSLYLDRTNGKAYINGGTKASPLWKLITSAM